MFFGSSPQDTRRYFVQSWQKHLKKQPLEPLEQQLVQVILEHPEYHTLLVNEESALAHTYFPEQGEVNPFLHMGLHLAIRDQVAADRPLGMASLFRKMLLRYKDIALIEHKLMDCLAECMWQAQKAGTLPDETRYLQALNELL